MASNDLAVFQGGGLPAHLAQFAEQLGDNTTGGGVTVPSLSPAGKVWTISLNGQRTKLEKRDSDGEVVPVNILKVVILDLNKNRGRTYYEGAYDPDKESAPVCWSDDGITPDPTSLKLQAAKCADCPLAVKGSKVTDNGKSVSACAQHRMLAVVPSHKLDFEPLRLKIAITSDWDKESPQAAANMQQGWFALQNYRDFLKSMNVPHTAMIVTKMKFDPNAQYPKILFGADRPLTPEEVATIAPIVKSDKVAKLLGGTWTPAGPDGVRKDQTTAAAPIQEPEVKKAVAAAAPAPAPAPADEEDDGEIIMAGLDAPAETPVQQPAQAAVTPKAQTTTAAPKAAAAEPQPEVKTVADPALNDLLNDWGG
jgi:hypothetical protein